MKNAKRGAQKAPEKKDGRRALALAIGSPISCAVVECNGRLRVVHVCILSERWVCTSFGTFSRITGHWVGGACAVLLFLGSQENTKRYLANGRDEPRPLG